MRRSTTHQEAADDDFEENIQEQLERVRQRFAETATPDEDMDVNELRGRSKTLR